MASKVLSNHKRDFGFKYSHFGTDTYGHDVKAFGDTTGAYVFWDASANTLKIVGLLDLDPLSGSEGINIGANSNTVGSGIALTRASKTAGTRFYSDDGGAALTGTGSVPDLRGALSRLLITKDNTGGDVRLHGLMGQLKSYDGSWNDEVVSAVNGRLEIVRSAETVTLGGYGVSAAVLGIPATSGTITVDTNHVLAGIAALADFKATLTQTGSTVGVYVSKYNTSQWSDATTRYNWKYGVYVDEDSVDYCPIAVGKFVASAASGGGFAVTLTNSAAMRIYSEVTADLTSAATVRSILGRMLVTGNVTSTAECFGAVGQLVVKNAKMQHDNAGVMGTFEVQTTAATISGDIADSICSAVLGRVGVSITGTGVEADGILSGVAAMSNITAGFVTVTSGGVLAGLYVGRFASKQVWDYALYCDPGSISRILCAGSSSSAVTCDTADTKFVQIYTDSGATSGDNRGIYNRLSLTGAGGGGESLRSYTEIVGVAAGTAHGAHISLGMGESTTKGSVTGLGVAMRATLGLPNVAMDAGGTYAAVMAEIYSFGTNSDAGAVTSLACFRVVNGGTSGGMDDVDDDAVLFDFSGWTSATVHLYSKAQTPTTIGSNVNYTLKVKMPDGALGYIPIIASAVTSA